MDAHLLVRSKFMVSREFGTLDIPKEPLVTIVDVKKPAEDEEATKGWWLVTFAEPWAKPLKVNGTHREALALMFGWETDDWKGKRIGLHAMVGTFFGRRQTAVRIKGSPDLKEPRSFSIQKFGGGRDTYSLVPMAGGSAPNGNGHSKSTGSNGAPKVYPPMGTVDFGPNKGTQIVQLLPAELAAAIALAQENIAKAPPGASWVPKTQANLHELMLDQQRRAKLEEQMASGGPPPGAPRINLTDLATPGPAEPGSDDIPF